MSVGLWWWISALCAAEPREALPAAARILDDIAVLVLDPGQRATAHPGVIVLSDGQREHQLLHDDAADDPLRGVGVGARIRVWRGLNLDDPKPTAAASLVLLVREIRPSPPAVDRVGPVGCRSLEPGAGAPVPRSEVGRVRVEAWTWVDGRLADDQRPQTRGRLEEVVAGLSDQVILWGIELPPMAIGERVGCVLPEGTASFRLLEVIEPPVPPGFSRVPADAAALSSGIRWWTASPGAGPPPGLGDAFCVELTERDPRGLLLERPRELCGVNLYMFPPDVVELYSVVPLRGTVRAIVPAGLSWRARVSQEPRYVEVNVSEVLRAISPREDLDRVPPDALPLEDGVAWKRVRAGSGTAHPSPHARVEVRYTAWAAAVAARESSEMLGSSTSVLLRTANPAWRQAIRQMVAGDHARVWVPQSLSEERDDAGRPASAVYDIQLLSILEPEPPPLPVATPPRDALRDRRGLAWVVLHPGSGAVRPDNDDVLRLHYAAWTTGGEVLGSSRIDGDPLVLNRALVGPGWSGMLARMTAGEKVMVWIPGDLLRPELTLSGYELGHDPDAPQGADRVFVLELLDVRPDLAKLGR